jgi:hypothetical protein
MEAIMSKDYGLQITHNSKVGCAFSLPRSSTCIGRTQACTKVCYGNGIRYQSTGQKQKRERNFRTVELLLLNGGPAVLAENLVILIDQARPIDWIASKITGIKTQVPWTFRIHDIGDFHSIEYVEAWTMAVKHRAHCSFWFYTRSFLDEEMFAALTELASRPNCKGWLSLDRDNYNEGIIRYCESDPGNWCIALLQEQEEVMPLDAIPYLSCFSRTGDLLSFPKHHGGKHVAPVRSDNMMICPQVTGLYKLQTAANTPKPCQSCGHCLP